VEYLEPKLLFFLLAWLLDGVFWIGIGFIGHSHTQLVTTSKYNTIAYFHITSYWDTLSSHSSVIVSWQRTLHLSSCTSLTYDGFVSQPHPCNSANSQWLSRLNHLRLSRDSKSKLCYDRRRVGQSMVVSSNHLGLMTRFVLLSDCCGFVDVERSLWREDGSVIYNCSWSSPAQSFLDPRPVVVTTLFYCLRFETSLFVASYDSQVTVEVFDPAFCQETPSIPLVA
jgi:hypothetical protein